MTPTSSPRGFTLLELVLGATLVLIVSAVAMGVMVSVQSVQRDAQAKSVITRDAQFVLDTIARDLQYVGNGVPRGREVHAGGGTMLLRPPIRIARPDYLAFVGDLPFPNSDLNGAAVLQNVGNPVDPLRPDPAEARNHLHVSSELALCTPPDVAPSTGTYTCRTGAHRLVDVGSTTNCDFTNALTAATCPWSLGKWQAAGGMFPFTIVISSPTGSWVRRRVVGFEDDFRDAVSLHLDHGYPTDSNPPGAGTRGDVHAPEFVQRRSGASLVAHLDRVFYSLEQLDGSACGSGSDCLLRRRQCWGWADDLDPDDNDFPRVGALPILSPAGIDAISSCDPAQGEGTGWEPIMHGITSLSFRYFATSDPDVEVTTASWDADKSESVMFVQIDVTLARTLPGATPGATTTLRQSFTKRVFLENGGGAFIDDANPRLQPGVALPGPAGVNDVSAANGGCQTALTCGRP